MPDDLLKIIITSAFTLAGSWLVLRGGKHTADASRAASTDASRVDAQDSALEAWKQLLEPYRVEVARVNERLDGVHAELDATKRMLGHVRTELASWQRSAKIIARWAIKLRDEVRRLGGTIPATPDELLLIQAIDDASVDEPDPLNP